MDLVLRKKLPIEIVEIIMEFVHKLNMKTTLICIEYSMTWVNYKKFPCYSVSNNFKFLELEQLIYDNDYEPV